MPSSRRTFLATSASALAGLAGCVSLDQLAAHGNWPRRTLTNAHTGQSPTDGPTQSLHIEWHRSRDMLGGVATSPVVRDGTLYYAYSREAREGAPGGAWLEAFDAATGESRWTTELFRTEEFYYFNHADSLVVDGDRIFVQTNAGLKAVGTDGTVDWTFDNQYEGQLIPDAVPPIVTEDVVVTGTYQTSTRPDQVEAVFGLDPATGEERWRAEFPDLDDMWQLAASDGVVYVPMLGGGGTGTLVALDMATGEELWRWEAPLKGTPTIVGDTLLTGFSAGGDQDSVGAVDLPSRTITWKAPVGPRWADAGLTVANGLVYHAAGFGLDARRLDNGERVWRYGCPGDDSAGSCEGGPEIEIRSTPVVAGDAVYAQGWIQRDTAYGHLFVVDARTGSELARGALGRNQDMGIGVPAVTSDLAFVSTNRGELFAFGECEMQILGRCLVG